jgi:type IX secretion system PorP/SprF family membrane protein
MQKILLILIVSFPAGDLISQNLPTFRQFNLNPVIFNPAYNAIENFTEVSLIHRQQWLKFEDAPVASGAALQLAMYSRASLGLSIITQESVALRNTLAKTIFAYKIPISKDQEFSFGITFGIGFNDLDLEGVDYSNDPAILNAADNKAYADASFGMLYSLKGLKVGFALPRLFGQPYISPQQLSDNGLSQLLNQLYSLSYKMVLTEVISLEPYALYRLARDFQNSWEAACLVYFKDKIWTGASYHSTQGVGFFLGMSISNKFRFGYSYELPPFDEQFISTSSHELQLNMRVSGKKDLVRKPNYEQ